MTKYDVSNMAPGMVFEIAQNKDPNSPLYGNTYNDDTFMVISSVSANSRMETVIVAPVIEYDDDNAFGVQFLIRRGGTTVTKIVCVDRMFKVMKKRLCRFRYVVSREIVDEINASIQKLFFGEPLYTKDQALAVAYKEQMSLIAANVQNLGHNASQSDIPLDGAVYESAEFNTPEDYKPKSQAEEEAEFARKMLTNPDPVVAKITIHEGVKDEESLNLPEPESVKIKKKKSVIITSNKKELKPKAKNPAKKERTVIIAEETKPAPVKRGNYGKYSAIRENWEDFLLDYTDLPNAELMDKYDIPDIATVYRLGKECKSIAAEHGMDTKDFRRKPVLAGK